MLENFALTIIFPSFFCFSQQPFLLPKIAIKFKPLLSQKLLKPQKLPRLTPLRCRNDRFNLAKPRILGYILANSTIYEILNTIYEPRDTIMRYSRMLIPTVKEVPSDAEIPSHKLMIRSGMMRKLASGTYTYLPLGFKSLLKVIAIVREEMNNAGAQEILMPA